MIRTPEAKKYGKKLQELSAKYITQNAKLFKPSDSKYKNKYFDEDILRVYDDAANLFIAGSYMIEGDFDAAMDVVCHLDTAVRDEIPTAAYNYLCKFTVDQQY